MRVRLNLARALLHRPDVLFLDEPTSGLDPVTTRLVRSVISAERDRGAAIFLTTHDMGTAEALCDRVAFMVEGMIAACDTPRALRMANSPRQARVEYLGANGLESETVALDRPQRLTELIGTNRIEAIHTMERGLDDVFTEVTGSRL
ncbi:hypothetical protein BH23ACT5_BH23ACT5_23410 [soil metagenome]